MYVLMILLLVALQLLAYPAAAERAAVLAPTSQDSKGIPSMVQAFGWEQLLWGNNRADPFWIEDFQAALLGDAIGVSRVMVSNTQDQGTISNVASDSTRNRWNQFISRLRWNDEWSTYVFAKMSNWNLGLSSCPCKGIGSSPTLSKAASTLVVGLYTDISEFVHHNHEELLKYGVLFMGAIAFTLLHKLWHWLNNLRKALTASALKKQKRFKKGRFEDALRSILAKNALRAAEDLKVERARKLTQKALDRRACERRSREELALHDMDVSSEGYTP